MAVQVQEKGLKTLLKEGWSKGMSYGEYRNLVGTLAERGGTTGLQQTEAYIDYTVLNDRRMKRWDKTLNFDGAVIDTLESLDRQVNGLVLTESWCGDAAPALPVMHKISSINDNIRFKYLLRDENLNLMNSFLTNGNLSIPKLILFDPENYEVLGSWGSRSARATQLVDDFKKDHGALTAAFRQNLQLWYNKDKGKSILDDLLKLLALK